MLSIIYESRNKKIDLINTPNLTISSYDGLNQPVAEIVSLSNPNIRGTRYQRSSIQDRQISFIFYVYDVEKTRRKIMDVFKSGEKGTLYLKNEYREGKIDCYTEEVNFDRFQQLTTLQIVLRAPDPYFEGLNEIFVELDNIISQFTLEADIPEEGIDLGVIVDEHTATIVNNTDIDLGFIINVYANGEVKNPVIKNMTTNKKIGVEYTLNAGDLLVINTNKGNKKITLGDTNLINNIYMGSSFFELVRGENILVFESADGTGSNANVIIEYNDKYEAI